MNFGSALRIGRAVRSLSQRELAEMVGVDTSYLSLVERGQRNPSSAVVERISASLGIPHYLFMLLAAEKEDLVGIDKEASSSIGLEMLKLIMDREDGAS